MPQHQQYGKGHFATHPNDPKMSLLYRPVPLLLCFLIIIFLIGHFDIILDTFYSILKIFYTFS